MTASQSPRQRVVDLAFLDARSKLIDLAAFLDRVDRHPGSEDYRVAALKSALVELSGNEPDRARRVLEALSDPTEEPAPRAETQGATGAWRPPETCSPS